MRSKIFIAAILFAGFVTCVMAQGVVKQVQSTASIDISKADIQILSAAIAIASRQCGADNPVACQIGLNANAENEKLKAALDTILALEAKDKSGSTKKP